MTLRCKVLPCAIDADKASYWIKSNRRGHWPLCYAYKPDKHPGGSISVGSQPYSIGEERRVPPGGGIASCGMLRFVTSRGYRLHRQEKWLQPAPDKGYRLVTSCLFRSV